jgi:hypothetical protein
MAEENTDSTLGIPNNFVIGEATGCGDSFLDSLAQGMNELCIPGRSFNGKSLRRDLHDYAEGNQTLLYNSQNRITLRKAISDAAAAEICAPVGRNEFIAFASYVVHITLTAAERAVLNLGAAMWGRPEIEGHMFCQMYGIKLHLTFMQRDLNSYSQPSLTTLFSLGI